MMEPPRIDSFEFHCCFCDGKMEEIFTIILVWPDEEGQEWWCHKECFAEKLHPTYRQFRDEE